MIFNKKIAFIYAILSWKCYIKTNEKRPTTAPSSFLDESMRMLLQEYFHHNAFPQSKLLQYFSPILLKGVKQIVFRRGMTKILLKTTYNNGLKSILKLELFHAPLYTQIFLQI